MEHTYYIRLTELICNQGRNSAVGIFCLEACEVLGLMFCGIFCAFQEEAKRKEKEEKAKTESVAISTEDAMETIEEENNTPQSLNKSFSFVSE